MSTKYVVLAIALSVVFSILALVSRDLAPLELGSEFSFEREHSHWISRIEKVGGQSAYLEFAKAVASTSIEWQHMHAHAFGAALYDAEGLKGLVVCDARFSQGCFHDFIGQAISREGLSIVSQIHTLCAQAVGDKAFLCEHGVGHGVLAYFGYSEDDLRDALIVCAPLDKTDRLHGCFNGAFMEYNVRTLASGRDDPRPLESNDWFAPCDSLTGRLRNFCLFSQPLWWHQTLKHQGLPEKAIVRSSSRLCYELEGEERAWCFWGLGFKIPPAVEHNVEESVDLCKIATDESQSMQWCLESAAKEFRITGLQSEASALCGFAPDQKGCITALMASPALQ